MKELVFLLLLNLPTGEQVTQSAIPMDARQCLAMQESVWNGPNEIAWRDEYGPAPMVDAACAPLPPCDAEDSHDCIWYADKRGNGFGVSFVNVDGQQFPIQR